MFSALRAPNVSVTCTHLNHCAVKAVLDSNEIQYANQRVDWVQTSVQKEPAVFLWLARCGLPITILVEKLWLK